MYAANDIISSATSVVVQMLSPDEERLVDLFANVIVSTTSKELHEQKRNTLSTIQQQGTEPQ